MRDRIRRTLQTTATAFLLLGVPACAPGTFSGFDGQGSSADDESLMIRRTQALLADLDYYGGPADGIIGPRTAAAIRDYQRDRGLAVTGEPSWTLVADLQDRSQGKTVGAIQSRLAELGFYHAAIDGRDGAETRGAIRSFQAAKGMDADGRITPRLLNALQIDGGRGKGNPKDEAGPPSVKVTRDNAAPGSGRADQRLAPGDRVNVRVANGPDEPGQVYALTVAPSGKLAIPDAGEIQAAGKRPKEIENAVAMALLERYLRRLSVKVDVGKEAAAAQPVGTD